MTVPAVVDPVSTADSRRSAAIAQERMRVLYRIHAESLIRACQGWTCGDRHSAEDLVQETMVRAWRNLEKFDCDPAALRPWLMTVARRVSIDALRARSARAPEVLDNWWFEWVVEAPEPYCGVHDRSVIREALHALSEEHSAVLVQVYLFDQTVAQAARNLGIPQGTAKSRLHYALRAVRERLGDDRAARGCLEESSALGAS